MIALFEVFGFAVAVVILFLVGKANKGKTVRSMPCKTMRCPSCGSTADVRGEHWECPYCGDSGRV